ncbi:MAG TPA: DUF4383 domain-containing protein [Acidimicrobiales bacterium]|jgi:hypothetical protein|nr:DUF4383 domain-containing protein [Acidimicrobiales bacterium]
MASSTQGMRDAEVRRDDDRPAVRTSPSQLLALIVGLAFTAAGIAGFFVTGTEDFTNHDTGETLLGLEINGLHNVVHLALGLAGLVLSARLATARLYGWLLAIGYGGAFVFGLFAVDEEDINFLSLNDADNWFHLASAAVGLVIALLPATRAYRDSRSATAR